MIYNKKEETMNVCSAKKRTLQSFVMKKADTLVIQTPGILHD